ncbi:hypothetical protein MHYP_G00336940 [Metynnis hypsauchen]
MLNFTASSTKHLIKLTQTPPQKEKKTSKGKQCLSYTKKSTICFITHLKKERKKKKGKKSEREEFLWYQTNNFVHSLSDHSVSPCKKTNTIIPCLCIMCLESKCWSIIVQII